MKIHACMRPDVMDANTLLDILLFILPAYVANAFPVIAGGRGPKLDFGRGLGDGRRVFGDGKTVVGFIAGVFAGWVCAVVIAMYYQIPGFAGTDAQIFCGFMLGFGTMLGDAFGSFIKRRLGREPGSQFILDQLMFLAVALVFAYPFAPQWVYTPFIIVGLFIVTYFLHIGSNILANRLKLKKVPW
ncbi:MAG: CDP-2,3-bis-(O-geranylgeranyl)-sn-glycerol synthase [Candidatus Bilamarchaeaceae archaeon]